ncbi:MAG TPA: tetratricopeptide repeat protein [Terriglobales bacterium]|nr:tetratricopeptide repeat protein [Terriglobales bacterium]
MRGLRPTLTLVFYILTTLCAAAQNWEEVRSPHFTVITNAGAKQGKAVAQRFEQMRYVFGTLILRDRVNINVPLQIVAFKDNRGLKQVAPLWKGKPIDLAGVYLGGEDKHFIALDLSSEAGYPVVFHEYAHLLLNANFPKSQLWFDEGFAEYYSTIDIWKTEVKIGKTPQFAGQILSEGLMPVEQLFNIKHESKEYNETGPKRHTLYAQSWLAVHYLYDMKKLAEAGKYFDLVLNKQKPMAEALKLAFGMTPKEFDKALKDYYTKNQVAVYVLKAPLFEPALYTSKKIKDHEADAVIADFHLHSRDHFDLAKTEFEKVLVADPNHSEANRGLGYYYLSKGEIDKAGSHFRRAAALGSTDARVYFYLARFTFQNVNGAASDMQDLQEMGAALNKAIELDPNYAEAYNLKAFVLSAAKNHPEAIEALRNAIRLSPRNEQYRANLANQYLYAGKYDEATAIWAYLKQSSDPNIASMAANQEEMAKRWKEKPLLRLEGETESLQATSPQWRRKDGQVDPDAKALEERQQGVNTEKEETVALDTRPIKFIKGMLNRVDCMEDGSAIMTVTSSAGKVYRMVTKNPDKLVIIGGYRFACNWKNQKVAVNYRAKTANSGDIVSVEVQ